MCLVDISIDSTLLAGTPAPDLYDQHRERALAHAMFRWLAEHAERYGFSELHRINENNTPVAA